MKKFLFSIVVCFSSVSFVYAEGIEMAIENVDLNNKNIQLAYVNHGMLGNQNILNDGMYLGSLDTIAHQNNTIDNATAQYQNSLNITSMKEYGLFTTIIKIIVNDFSSSIDRQYLATHALGYNGKLKDYDITGSPSERYNSGSSAFDSKSMNLFFPVDYAETAPTDMGASIIINSLASMATKGLIGLSIWSGTDMEGVAGFKTTIKPFKNLYFAYTWLTNKLHENRSIFKINYEYKDYSNLSFKTMNRFDEEHINTSFGVEWSFYF